MLSRDPLGFQHESTQACTCPSRNPVMLQSLTAHTLSYLISSASTLKIWQGLRLQGKLFWLDLGEKKFSKVTILYQEINVGKSDWPYSGMIVYCKLLLHYYAILLEILAKKTFYMFCSLFWPWPCTRHNSCLLRTEEVTIETCSLCNSCIVYESKTKDSALSWTFQHKSWHYCLVLWCLPSFITSPSVNYAFTDQLKDMKLTWHSYVLLVPPYPSTHLRPLIHPNTSF